jgi:prepilin-type N-terminal cleavage/methylation domain-containing protein
MTKRFGFTLAEVLITLGIIGVVAAMTIPTLIANTNGAKYRSQFKKTISTLNQAGLMGQAQYDFDYAGTTVACKNGASDHPESELTFCSLLNGTLTGQTYYANLTDIHRNNNGTQVNYSIVSAPTIGTTVSGYHAYGLSDGSIVAFKSGAFGCTLNMGSKIDETWWTNNPNCIGFIDVNGATLPNKEVTCGTGTTMTATKKPSEPCSVKNDATHMTDIFPIAFHDATVEPATDAAKYVLTSSK